MGTGEIFLNRTPIAYALRSSINKWNLIKLQNFCKAKDILYRTKWQPTYLENTFTNPTSETVYIYIYIYIYSHCTIFTLFYQFEPFVYFKHVFILIDYFSMISGTYVF
jgi:hypothetical protein